MCSLSRVGDGGTETVPRIAEILQGLLGGWVNNTCSFHCCGGVRTQEGRGQFSMFEVGEENEERPLGEDDP